MTTEPTGGRRAAAGYSVRTRITTAVAVLVALALAAAGLLVWAAGHDRVRESVLDAVDLEIAELQEFQTKGVDPATGTAYASVRALVREFLLRNVPASSELMLGVWDGRVQVTSASPRVALRESTAFTEAVLPKVEVGGSGTVDSAWGPVYYEVLPLRDAEGPGAFVVAYFVEDELAPLARTMQTYAVAALVALAAVTAVAAWQAGRLLAPVRTLRETAEVIGETDLTRRIPEVGDDDLTDLTRTVNAMLDRLDAAFQGQRAFLDDAGHELRTPLTILRGHLELLDPQDADDVTRTRALLLDEVDRMGRLVDDMILLTKADQPGFLRPTPTDLDALVSDVAGKARGLGDRVWRLEVSAVGTAVLDEQRVTQALVQLCHNAVRHTDVGAEITLGAGTVEPGWVELSVADSGPGVPDPDKTAIFQRFARGSDPDSGPEAETKQAAGAGPGSGLGLAIVAAIAEAHGGSAYVTDAEPGARFALRLPTEPPAPTRHRIEGDPWPAS